MESYELRKLQFLGLLPTRTAPCSRYVPSISADVLEFRRRVMTFDGETPAPRSTIRLRLGRWLEARGTGWGVAVLPVLILALAFLVLWLHA
jgi:hypothetical protein